MLIKPPADLTTIAKGNGGTFPFWRVSSNHRRQRGAGARARGVPDAQLWRRFNRTRRRGFLPPQVRVLMLTHYVESLQKE
jgi:hypothetical protein